MFILHIYTMFKRILKRNTGVNGRSNGFMIVFVFLELDSPSPLSLALYVKGAWILCSKYQRKV